MSNRAEQLKDALLGAALRYAMEGDDQELKRVSKQILRELQGAEPGTFQETLVDEARVLVPQAA